LAYAEAQGISSLAVPTAAEIFGRDQEGKPVVDLRGRYPSGIMKAHNLNRCYRTPKLLLTLAHAINMGLLRAGGPLQSVTTKEEWQNLGYTIVSGDFSVSSVAAGAPVAIERDHSVNGHPIDGPDFNPSMDPYSVLDIQVCNDAHEEKARVTEGVLQDLEEGLRPEDLLVVTLPGAKAGIQELDDSLRRRGVKTFLPGKNGDKDTFHREGHVTVSNIFRAKGNEAWKVYACGLHMAGAPFANSPDEELLRRNQVFVALTRARLWCVALGHPGEIMNELRTAKEQWPHLTFRAFNQASLKRKTAHEEPLPGIANDQDHGRHSSMPQGYKDDRSNHHQEQGVRMSLSTFTENFDQFQEHVTKLFQNDGWEVEKPDPGESRYDLIVRKDNDKRVVRLRWLPNSTVQRPQVRQFHGFIEESEEGAEFTKAFFITTKGFGNPAQAQINSWGRIRRSASGL
jgi:superfamily I DNA and RNA helicase